MSIRDTIPPLFDDSPSSKIKSGTRKVRMPPVFNMLGLSRGGCELEQQAVVIFGLEAVHGFGSSSALGIAF